MFSLHLLLALALSQPELGIFSISYHKGSRDPVVSHAEEQSPGGFAISCDIVEAEHKTMQWFGLEGDL